MVIQKHDFPILERDSEQIAILMPNRKHLSKLAQKCVFAFLGDYVDKYALETNSEKVAEYKTCTKLFNVYQTGYKGKENSEKPGNMIAENLVCSLKKSRLEAGLP